MKIINRLLLGASLVSLTGILLSCGGPAATEPGDTTPPVVVVTSLTNGQEVGIPYMLQGNAADEGSGVDKVMVKVDNGNYSQVQLSAGNWSTNISLGTDGPHTNFIYAMDKAGNQSSVIRITIIRTSVPGVIIVSPPDLSITNISNVTVGGTANVDTPYNITNVQVSVNGGAYTNAAGTDNWSFAITLAEGTNTIDVKAFSDNGKQSVVSTSRIILETVLKDAVYVSGGGSDTFKGTQHFPLRSIPLAITYAMQNGLTNVRISEGTYDNTMGLNSSGTGILIATNGLNLTGGWNTDFSMQTGISILAGNNVLEHIMILSNITGFYFDRFVLTGAHAITPVDFGAGIFLYCSTNIIITNCVISNCSSDYGGGAFSLDSCSNCVIHGEFNDNTVVWEAGGGLISMSDSIKVFGCFSGNNGGVQGGGLSIYACTASYLDVQMISNYVTQYGGGLCFMQSGGSTVIVTGSFIGNTALWCGGGIYSMQSYQYKLIDANLSGNTAHSNGSALYLFPGNSVKVYNCVMTDNIGKSVICHDGVGGSSMYITNCLIGGTNGSGITGIMEIAGNMTSHRLIGNSFITNTMHYLYHDYVNGDSDAISNVNSTAWTGATVASGNKVTNI